MKSITKEAKELLTKRGLLKSKLKEEEEEDFKLFKAKLNIYRNDINKAPSESEEHHKNILKDFLNNAFGYNCNTKGKIDLVINYNYGLYELTEEIGIIENKQKAT